MKERGVTCNGQRNRDPRRAAIENLPHSLCQLFQHPTTDRFPTRSIPDAQLLQGIDAARRRWGHPI